MMSLMQIRVVMKNEKFMLQVMMFLVVYIVYWHCFAAKRANVKPYIRDSIPQTLYTRLYTTPPKLIRK